MSSHKITVTMKFEAMHRIPKHSGKCKYIHGHSYKAIVTFSAPSLDAMGMVLDFGVVKGKVRAWIDEKWDHNSILNSDDPLMKFGRQMVKQKVWKSPFEQFGDKEPYTLNCNPTAENMAQELFNVIQDLLDIEMREVEGLAIDSVTIQETEDCYATFVPEIGGGSGEGEGEGGSNESDDGDDGEDDTDSEGDDEEGGEDDDDQEEEEADTKQAGKKDGKPDPKARRYREI